MFHCSTSHRPVLCIFYKLVVTYRRMMRLRFNFFLQDTSLPSLCCRDTSLIFHFVMLGWLILNGLISEVIRDCKMVTFYHSLFITWNMYFYKNKIYFICYLVTHWYSFFRKVTFTKFDFYIFEP